jgi:TonB family protein
MKKLILGLIFCSLFFTMSAQEHLLASNTSTTSAFQNPAFPGGEKAMQEFLQAHLQYPELAKENCTEGEVVLCLHLNQMGRVDSVEVLRGIGFGCDEEALRLTNAMPCWSPAYRNGMAVPSTVKVPLKFRLQ